MVNLQYLKINPAVQLVGIVQQLKQKMRKGM